MLGLLVAAVFLTHIHDSACSYPRAIASNESCPTWLYLSEEGLCTCGSSLLNVILCNNVSQEVGIMNSFCLTSFDSVQDPKRAVVGRCLYAQNNQEYIDGSAGLYIEVDRNLSRQDHQLCDYLNRRGRLCGSCKKNHFISAYSYDLKCHKCHIGWLGNVVVYVTVAYVPLTVFLLIVVVFHISVTSPRLNVTILLCQIYALPAGLLVLTQLTQNTQNSAFIQFFATIYGIWNLDFFRALVPPICLPLNTMQVFALDYLIAVYPLFLLVCFYALVAAHDRGYRLSERLWRPFLWCSARIRQQWNIRHSLIDAFASFIMLSFIKLVSTSGSFIVGTRIFDIHGAQIGYFMYYDATVEFMGREHLPYFIIAVTVLLTAILFPLLLLLYPMKLFQVFLNKCHLNSPGLRMLVECFQGYYRDKTDGGWECRYFAVVYPSLRIVGAIMYALTPSNVLFPMVTLVLTGAILITLFVRPYKEQYSFYTKLDIAWLSSATAICASFSISLFYYDWQEIVPEFGFVLGGLFSLVPLLYFVWLGSKEIMSLLKTKGMSHYLQHITFFVSQRKPKQEGVINREEYEELGASDILI